MVYALLDLVFLTHMPGLLKLMRTQMSVSRPHRIGRRGVRSRVGDLTLGNDPKPPTLYSHRGV